MYPPPRCRYFRQTGSAFAAAAKPAASSTGRFVGENGVIANSEKEIGSGKQQKETPERVRGQVRRRQPPPAAEAHTRAHTAAVLRAPRRAKRPARKTDRKAATAQPRPADAAGIEDAAGEKRKKRQLVQHAKAGRQRMAVPYAFRKRHEERNHHRPRQIRVISRPSAEQNPDGKDDKHKQNLTVNGKIKHTLQLHSKSLLSETRPLIGSS